MKRIEDLTREDCQEFLNEMFDNSVEYTKTIYEADEIESCGIEYNAKDDVTPCHNEKCLVSFSNPELISWLYKHDVDLTTPLQQLKYDYIEMDETNSILFEYAMNINKVLNENIPDDLYQGQGNKKKIERIKETQKDLISKL